MPVILNPKLTDAGKAAAVNAKANGFALAITHIALGTGKYDSAVSGAGMTTMVGRKEQVLIGAGVVTGAGGFRVAVRFNAWTGTPNPYSASEVGFYAGDPANGGVLFAVFSHPSDVIVQRNSLDYVASFSMQLTDVPVSSITINVDPNAAQALAMLSLHENATDPHKGYVKKSGDISTGYQLGPTPPQHDSTQAYATTEFTKRQGLAFPAGAGGIGANTAAYKLTVAQLGSWVEAQVNFQTIMLPKAKDCPIGGAFQIVVSVPVCTLVPTPGDILMVSGYGELAYQVFSMGETVTVVRNSETIWYIVGSGFRMPAGTVSYFAGISPPAGWLKLNGAVLARNAYPALWSFAQGQGVVSENDWWNNGYSGRFSIGAIGTDFRLPDTRGMFLRSLDDGRGVDAGRGWGTYQDHANRAHSHGVVDNGHTHTVYDPGHRHGGTALGDGDHAHGAYEGINGGYAYTGFSGLGNNGSAQGMPAGGAGFGTNWSSVAATGIAGRHGHGLSIDAALSGVSLYASTTGIYLNSEGSEARPKNLAYVMAIKF